MGVNRNIPELPKLDDPNDNTLLEAFHGGKNMRILLGKIKDFIVSTLSFKWIDFIPQSTTPTYVEGRVYYDDIKKALTYFNDSSEIAVNIGQEVLFIVENQTGGLLANGTVISPDETTVITKADAYYKNKSRIIAVLTEDIADGETGYATKLGQVGGLDTSMFSPGQVVYLGSDGEIVADTPIDGGYICIVGVVDISSATEGVITVDTSVSDTTVEVTDTNGFPPDQRAATSLLFLDGSRLFSILPTGTDFHFYELGDKYQKIGGEALTISDITGGHIIYYDSGVLTEIANPTSSQAEHIILNHAIVAYIYWNATTSKGVIVQDERHSISMSPQTHLYLHQRFGAFYVSGLALQSFVIGNGSLSSHAQFSNALGIIKDEDIAHDISAIASTLGLEYLYRTGATGVFTSGTNTGYSFPIGATPLPQYNEWTGATWQLTEINSGDYMNIHIFANGNINQKPIVLLGTAEYTQLNAASAGQANELSTILASLPLPEFVLIGSVIIEGKTSFTNAVNARVVENSEGQNYTNWTTTELAAGAAPTNHNNLAGLEQAGAGVTLGHVSDQPQTVEGLKTLLRDLTILDERTSATPLSTFRTGYYIDQFEENPGVALICEHNYAFGNTLTKLFMQVFGVDMFSINHLGVVSILTTPTIDSGTNDVLTWNASTKAIEKRNLNTSTSLASSATPTPTGSAKENEYYLTALAANATFAAPSGTAVNGNNLIIRIKDNGTARTLAFNAIYRAVGVTLPTTTIISKTLYLGCIYNSTESKFDVVSVVQEA